MKARQIVSLSVLGLNSRFLVCGDGARRESNMRFERRRGCQYPNGRLKIIDYSGKRQNG